MTIDTPSPPTIRDGLKIGSGLRTAAVLAGILGGIAVTNDNRLVQYAGVGALTLAVLLLVVVVAKRVQWARQGTETHEI